MVEHPQITEEEDGSLVVWDVSDVQPRGSWRFLGWLLLGASLAIAFYDVRSWQYLAGSVELLVPVGIALAGVVVLRLASETQRLEQPLLRVVAAEQPGGAPRVERPSPAGAQAIKSEDLAHVGFGLVDASWPGRRGVTVEAFAIYLGTQRGECIPVVDGTLAESEAFRVAEQLSSVLRIPLKQRNKGAPCQEAE